MLCLSVCYISEAGVGRRHLKQFTDQQDALVNTGRRPSRASVGTGARTELAHDAVMWNRSHGAKKKRQISTFHHIEGFSLGTRKVSF